MAQEPIRGIEALIEAFTIMRRYDDNISHVLCGRLGVAYVLTTANKEDIFPPYLQRLAALGWYYDDEHKCFAMDTQN